MSFIVDLTPRPNAVEATIEERIYAGALDVTHDRWTMTLGDEVMRARVVVDERDTWVEIGGEVYRCTVGEEPTDDASVSAVRTPVVIAPMPGKVLQVAVSPGDRVTTGDALLVLEAMKMETVIEAEADAEVVAVHATAGSMVQPGQALVELAFD